ncbi:hypothetical protein ST47_g3573 [Ascochyta rabiei]|uniref:Uncharacterized protein n=1 Tax=Didymella rabiei TaxID=5454 RepID=A0A163HG46_DIDRA|nr:hypothetical protein ST47_g3573 [Ascochyta rabiei]
MLPQYTDETKYSRLQRKACVNLLWDGKANIVARHVSEIIDSLNPHCKDSAGVCGPSWTIECGSDGPPRKIKVTPNSQHDAKLKKGLIDALKAAIDSETKLKSPGRFTPTKGIFCEVPSFISITHRDDWNADGVPDATAFTVTNPGDDGAKASAKLRWVLGRPWLELSTALLVASSHQAVLLAISFEPVEDQYSYQPFPMYLGFVDAQTQTQRAIAHPSWT